MNHEDAEEMVRGYLRWQEGESEHTPPFAANFRSHGPGPFESTLAGLENVNQSTRGWRGDSAGERKVHAVALCGDLVFAWIKSGKTVPATRYMSESMLRMLKAQDEETGITVRDTFDSEAVLVLKMRDGKIAEQWVFSSLTMQGTIPGDDPHESRKGAGHNW